ncbi:hypothetical protein J1N35_011626 [Gossypium stocksii]|uniref:Uncharacterized protein n=1 Tax=Gossypium stocksii TaxID=47602 RepID=A0A9D3W3V1_9ROSI|nr:hypothetical protein J1N35_011626 [Gossypium stocksii]
MRITQMFDQFMGITQAPPPQQPQQPQLEVIQPAPPAQLMPIVIPSKGDLVKEIQKRGFKEFLGDKSEDPTVVE